MDTRHPNLFTGITKRHWTGLLLVWLLIGILFLFLYRTARQAILHEVRNQALGVAVATAAGISPDDIAEVRSPADSDKPAFMRIQSHLERISRASPDIRYVYTMRRDDRAGAAPTDFLYIVDQPASDDNDNGVIDPDEISEAPGAPYDASGFPEMLAGWSRPSADLEVTPDPPYPDLISGYAPIKDDLGRTMAIVGVDITAATVRSKYAGIRAVNLFVGCLLCLLVTLVVQLYYLQREAFERNKQLSDEVESRNEMLRGANAELSRNNDRFQQELRLAENVQRGFLPSSFPRRDRLAFDKFYLASDVLGGDLFDVFSDQEDHVAMYMADVAGHGASAALISGLLKMAVNSVRERHGIAKGRLHADLIRPNEVLTTLNEMLVREIPEYEFITMVYGVVDLSRDTFVFASAGHPPPVLYHGKARAAALWNVPTGTAMGLLANQTYPMIEHPVEGQDKVLFYTDGLFEAMNEAGEEFGEARVLDLMREHGEKDPGEIITEIREAVETHRAGAPVNDDFSLLIIHVR